MKKNTQPNSEVGYASRREHPADQQGHGNVSASVLGKYNLAKKDTGTHLQEQLPSERLRLGPPGAPVGKTPCSQCRGLDPIPGQRTWPLAPQLRVHVPHLKLLHASAKTEDPECCNQGRAQPDKEQMRKKTDVIPRGQVCAGTGNPPKLAAGLKIGIAL